MPSMQIGWKVHVSDYEIETVERPYFHGYLNSVLLVNYGYEE